MCIYTVIFYLSLLIFILTYDVIYLSNALITIFLSHRLDKHILKHHTQNEQMIHMIKTQIQNLFEQLGSDPNQAQVGHIKTAFMTDLIDINKQMLLTLVRDQKPLNIYVTYRTWLPMLTLTSPRKSH